MCLSPSTCAASPAQSATSDCLDRWPYGRVFRGINVANPNADALDLHDNVERVSINDMRHATVERRGIRVECEQQGLKRSTRFSERRTLLRSPAS